MNPIFIAILLGTAIGIAVGLGTYLSEMKERSEQPKGLPHFREELQKTISKENVTWEHIQVLARYHSVTPFGIKKALEALASQRLADESDSHEVFLSRVLKFLHELETEEPFQGLPDETQFHLKQIHEKLSDNAYLLQPFARHLRGMMEERSAAQRRQRLVNNLSLVVGLVGLCVGIFSYWSF